MLKMETVTNKNYFNYGFICMKEAVLFTSIEVHR